MRDRRNEERDVWVLFWWRGWRGGGVSVGGRDVRKCKFSVVLFKYIYLSANEIL